MEKLCFQLNEVPCCAGLYATCPSLPSVGSSLCASTGPARRLLSTGFPQGHSLLWTSTCPGVGSCMGCRWISAPPWTSMDVQGHTPCRTMACRGVSAPAPGALSPPLSSLNLVPTGLFHIFSLLWLLLWSNLFPLPKYIVPESLPPSLMSPVLASSGSLLELAGIGSMECVGSQPYSPSAKKALHTKPIQQ